MNTVTRACTESAVCIVDTGGVVLEWSDAAERLDGFSRADVLGAHVDTVMISTDWPATAFAHARAHADDGRTIVHTWWRIRRDGSMYRARTAISMVRHERSGSPAGFVLVTDDLDTADRRP